PARRASRWRLSTAHHRQWPTADSSSGRRAFTRLSAGTTSSRIPLCRSRKVSCGRGSRSSIARLPSPTNQWRFEFKNLRPALLCDRHIFSLRLERTLMAKKTAARKPNAAFMKPVTPSAALSEVVGSKPIPRTEVTKKLWGYIKKNGLQDQKNKRMINADATLKTVFGGKSSVNMFDMTKLVSKHLK